jgi:DNA-binding XRE family transcriptional regulator
MNATIVGLRPADPALAGSLGGVAAHTTSEEWEPTMAGHTGAPPPWQGRPFLTVDDVAAIFGQEHARAAGADPAAVAAAPPAAVRTVHAAAYESKPSPNRKTKGRYVDNPMPLPQSIYPGRNNKTAVWMPQPGETVDELAERIRVWWRAAHPGRPLGGGAPRRGDVSPTAVGDRLRIRRVAARLTQTELGLLVGMSPQMVRSIELGRRPLEDPTEVRAIADALRIRIADLTDTEA